MAANTQTLKYIIEFDAKNAATVRQALDQMQKQMQMGVKPFQDTSKASSDLTGNLERLAGRAMLTIPIWTALRDVMSLMMNTIKDGAKDIVEMDTAISRAKMFSRGWGDDAVGFAKNFRTELNNLSLELGTSEKELSALFEIFTRGGLNTAEAFEVMRTAVQASHVTLGDSKEITQGSVDLYKSLGDSITDVSTRTGKYQLIIATMAKMYGDSSGKMSDYVNELRTAALAAGMTGMSFKQLVAIMEISNDGMKRNTLAGTGLTRMMLEMSKRSEQVRDLIGEGVLGQDITAVMIKTLSAIKNLPEARRLSELVNIFPSMARGGGGVPAALFKQLDELILKLQKLDDMETPDPIGELAEKAKIAMDTLDAQFKRLDQTREELGAAFVAGFFGINIDKGAETVETLKRVNEELIKMKGMATDLGNVAKWLLIILGGRAAIKSIISNPAMFAAVMAGAQYEQGKSLGGPGGAIDEWTANAVNEGKTPSFSEYMKKVPLNIGGIAYMTGYAAGVRIFGGTDLAQRSQGAKQFGQFPSYPSARPLPQIAMGVTETVVQEEKKLAISAAQGEYYKRQFETLDKMKALGYDELAIETRRLDLMVKMAEAGDTFYNSTKLAAQETKVLAAEIKLANEYAMEMGKNLTQSLIDLQSGKGNIGGVFSSIRTSMVEGYRKTASEGITNLVLSSGIGQLFGSAMVDIKRAFGGTAGIIESAFEKGGMSVYSWIVRAFLDAKSNRINLGAMSATSSGMGGLWSAAGVASMSGAPGVLGGAMNWLGQPLVQTIGQPTGISGPLMNNGQFYSKTGGGGGGGINIGQAAIQGALTGYSAYSSARAGGAPGWAAMGSGIMGGLGGIAGGIAGSMGALAASGAVVAPLLGMGPLGWTVLAAGLIIGSVMMGSMFNKKQVSTQVETKTMEQSLASRIDVSNSKLELINRNLVALRTTMETYIMPSSYYFSAARNIEDEFSLSARRSS